MGVIARTIGEQTFRPFAEECLHFTLTLVQSKDDPDLRKCAYGVFASLACVLKDDMAAALPVIIPLLMKAVESNEGVTAQLKDDDDESAFPAGDLLDDDEDVSPMDNEDDDEDSDVAGYTVENAYLEEKEEACLALRELAFQARYFRILLRLLCLSAYQCFHCCIIEGRLSLTWNSAVDLSIN